MSKLGTLLLPRQLLLLLIGMEVLAVRPALEADIYKDAKKYVPYRYLNLPKISCNYFTIKQYDLEVIKFKDEVRARIAMLNNYLSLSVMNYNISQFKDNLLLKVISSGNVGRKMTGIHFKGATASSINLYRDSNRNQILGDYQIPSN